MPKKKYISHSRLPFVIGVIIFLILIAAGVAFIGVIAFGGSDLSGDDDDGPNVKILTSASGYEITTENFGTCRDNVTIDRWRLHRVGKTVTFAMIGNCLNTSATSLVQIDFNFTQLPNPYKTPSVDGVLLDVVGTGSANEDTAGNAAYVEVSGDSNEECIDVNFSFESAITAGSNMAFSYTCIYQLD